MVDERITVDVRRWPHFCASCGRVFRGRVRPHYEPRFCSLRCAAANATRASALAARPVSERFWEKVAKSDGCWEWTACLFKNGYGKFLWNGKTTYAHKTAWILTHGPDLGPEDYILHRCDNRKCVNPDHLYMGDQSINVLDMITKGRAAWQKDPIAYKIRGYKLLEWRRANGRA